MSEDKYSFENQLLEQMRRLKAILPCCPNCEHFTQLVILNPEGGLIEARDEACGLDPQRRRPPASVIAFGCPKYSASIPF